MGKFVRIGVLVVIAAVVIGGFVFRDRITGAATGLIVGDCIDLPTEGEFEDVQHQPCTEPHEAEVFVVQDYANPPESLPSDAQFEAWIEANCIGQAFTDYVGRTYEAAEEIGVGWFTPTTEGWRGGDKEMVCYLAPVDGGKVSVPYRKAG